MDTPRPSHRNEASKKEAAGQPSESAAKHSQVDDDGDSGMTAQLAPQIIISPG